PRNITHGVPSFAGFAGVSVLINREGTPPSSSRPSTTSGYSSCYRGKRPNYLPDVPTLLEDATLKHKVDGQQRQSHRWSHAAAPYGGLLEAMLTELRPPSSASEQGIHRVPSDEQVLQVPRSSDE
ncbi:MAG: hypothetical protein LC790_05020, partial [Actinobacteria bacterium]|nr:hypothetical protein [Actinomycetota bacterium]